MKPAKKIPYPQDRERPVSGKQKKLQLQESREKKREEMAANKAEMEEDAAPEGLLEEPAAPEEQTPAKKPAAKQRKPEEKKLSEKQRMKNGVADSRAELFRACLPLKGIQGVLMSPQAGLGAWKTALKQLADQLVELSSHLGAAAQEKARPDAPAEVPGSSSPMPIGMVGSGTEPLLVMTPGLKNEIYQLVQLALQSGPLRGSDPGYFRRATTTPEHIEVAVEFLRKVAPILPGLGLSENQCNRCQKWLSDGEAQLEKKLAKPK